MPELTNSALNALNRYHATLTRVVPLAEEIRRLADRHISVTVEYVPPTKHCQRCTIIISDGLGEVFQEFSVATESDAVMLLSCLSNRVQIGCIEQGFWPYQNRLPLEDAYYLSHKDPPVPLRAGHEHIFTVIRAPFHPSRSEFIGIPSSPPYFNPSSFGFTS